MLETDASALSLYGAIGAGVSSLFFIWNKYIFGENSNSIIYGFICGFGVLIIYMFFMNRAIKFSIASNQEEVLEENKYDFEFKNKPKLPDKPTRVEYLKNKYFNKTEKELEYIINDSAMTNDAHKAASELLAERGVDKK